MYLFLFFKHVNAASMFKKDYHHKLALHFLTNLLQLNLLFFGYANNKLKKINDRPQLFR
jgi:hypothetical protein